MRDGCVICCRECRCSFRGNAVGTLWHSRGIPAAGFGRATRERCEWDASWYCSNKGMLKQAGSWPLARSPSPKRRHYDRELVHSLGLHDRRIPCSRWLMSCLRLCVRHCTDALKQGRLKARSKAVAALKHKVLRTSRQVCWCFVSVFLLQSLQCEYRRSNMRPWPCAFHAYHARAAVEDMVTKCAVLIPHGRCHGGRRYGSTASLVARRRRHRLEGRFLVTRCRSPRSMSMSHFPRSKHSTATLFGITHLSA